MNLKTSLGRIALYKRLRKLAELADDELHGPGVVRHIVSLYFREIEVTAGETSAICWAVGGRHIDI